MKCHCLGHVGHSEGHLGAGLGFVSNVKTFSCRSNFPCIAML